MEVDLSSFPPLFSKWRIATNYLAGELVSFLAGGPYDLTIAQ